MISEIKTKQDVTLSIKVAQLNGSSRC